MSGRDGSGQARTLARSASVVWQQRLAPRDTISTVRIGPAKAGTVRIAAMTSSIAAAPESVRSRRTPGRGLL